MLKCTWSSQHLDSNPIQVKLKFLPYSKLSQVMNLTPLNPWTSFVHTVPIIGTKSVPVQYTKWLIHTQCLFKYQIKISNVFHDPIWAQRIKCLKKIVIKSTKLISGPLGTDWYCLCPCRHPWWLPAADDTTVGLLTLSRSQPCPWSALSWPESIGTNLVRTNPSFYRVYTILDKPVWSDEPYSNQN